MAGVVALYRELDATVAAIEDLKRQNFRDFEVYSPTIRHELEHAVHPKESPVRAFMLVGGLLGVSFGYWIAIWTSVYWPLVVGGKAIASWIPYTIIGFEVFVLVGALSTVFGMFINSRIPRVLTSVGYDTRFTSGHFGIFVRCAPEQAPAATATLRQHGAAEVRNERY
ncbi:MAG TPA: DUF3341 domain-containing protein [Gemmatimonadaceae bacterium]|jgi:hypothetical protein|nr:DUF3341 domain-containing protein [Gemmatimonadaceae bacterium]